MEIHIRKVVKVQPIRTPNYILTDEDNIKFSLGELDEKDLIKLCDDFKKEVLKKAGYA